MTKVTRADEIAHRLTQQIVTRVLEPGSSLDETRLASSFGVSRTPIREAIRQLASSGLVELRPHRAAMVAGMDAARRAHLFDVMTELEILCALRASRAMTAAQRQELQALHEAMAALVRDNNAAEYRIANLDFHGLIYEGANNPYLKEITIATRERLALHRGVQLDSPARLAKSYAEHGDILRGIMRGDDALITRAMREHFAQTLAAVAELEVG